MRKKITTFKAYLIVTLVLLFASITMIAHGLRMMIQGLFHPQSYYPAPIPTTLDFWFDWFILFILGSIVLLISLKRWIHLIHTPTHTKHH